MTYDNQIVVSTARTIQEVEAMRDSWEKMESSPEVSIDYYLAIVKLRQHVIRPQVILLSQDGHPVTMLIGIIENMQLKYSIAGKVVLRPAVRSLTVILGGLIGKTSYSNSTILVSELLKSLKRREADIISFSEIPKNSPIYDLSKTKSSFFCRDHFPYIDRHYKMTLPSSIDKILKGKSRKRIRSQWKKLKSDFDGIVKVKTINETEQIERFCTDVEAISQKTYQHAYGDGFVCNTETKFLLSLLVEQGCLRAYILYIEDTPCAYWLGYFHKDTFYSFPVGGTGYDPKHKKYGVGILLMWQMIEDLCLDARIRYLDFGFMDTPYKRKLCELSWEEANFYIFQPTLKGISLNVLRVLFGLSHRFGNMILSHLELKDKWEKFKRASVATKQG